jgi:hypothetical protein
LGHVGANALSVVALYPTSQSRAPLANQARALVVNGGLSPQEATALLLETAWVM